MPCLLLLAACDGDPDFPELFTTEHFAYYAEEGAPAPCAGTEAWLERYYDVYTAFLGVSLPPGQRIAYYLAASDETLGCSSPFAAGCTRGSTIHARSPLMAHEVVHAVSNRLGHPPVLFQEGLAEVLSCGIAGDSGGPMNFEEGPIEELVETGAFVARRDTVGTGMYSASASFVRYLIDEHGASGFLAFYARAPLWGSRKLTAAVFQAELGVSLDDAFADWRARPLPHYSDICLRLLDCDPATPSLVDEEIALGCGPTGTLGSGTEALLRFAVSQDRAIHVTTRPVESVPHVVSSVSFYQCTGGNVLGRAGVTSGLSFDEAHNLRIDPAEPGAAFMLDVPAGDYVARLQGVGEARVGLDVEEPHRPMRGPACQPAEAPVSLDVAHRTTVATRWMDRPCEGPWCPGQSWDVTIGSTGGALEAQTFWAPFSPAELYICSEPCPEDPNSCEVLALDAEDREPVRSKQSFAPGTVLHLGAPAAPDAGYFAVRLRVAPEQE